MNIIILAAIIGACAAASLPGYVAPQYRYPYNYNYNYDSRARAAIDRSANILRSDSEVNEKGFRYAFDTDNGIHADETGVEANGIQAAGSYSYTGDDGQVYSVSYTADANGYQPQGAHLPTPPPIPAAIARSLEENARDEAAGIFDDGSYHDAKYAPGVVLARNQYRYNPFYPYRRY
ncbi:cuticular protein RR-1 [Spodoptera litura]|uniref:Cuticular protein RR-1 n=1 Tax=Spodoptera litura TaxID=69820 RepID=A0A4U7BF31_SPOLT|nr:cuticular protein RR-1 [Spodoptera litura]